MTKTIDLDGKQYKVITYYDCGFVEISLYEVVRPTWKFFRCKLLPFAYGTVWLEECSSVQEAIEIVYNREKQERKKREENRQKIIDFERN